MEDVEFDDAAGVVVVHARPTASRRGRCGTCRRRSPGFDHGDGRRRWRALDLGTVQAFVEVEALRVSCRRPVVAAVNGPAIGLGCSIALSCDIVLIADHTYLADTHVNVGLVCGDGGVVSWPFMTSLLKAQEYLLTGDRVPAD